MTYFQKAEKNVVIIANLRPGVPNVVYSDKLLAAVLTKNLSIDKKQLEPINHPEANKSSLKPILSVCLDKDERYNR